MAGNRGFTAGRGGFGDPFSGPVPKDVVALLAVVFGTYALKEFIPLLEYLRLTPLVWQKGFLWQLATYPFVGFGPPSLWILLSLLMIFWFGRDVCTYLGRRQFWTLLLWAVVTAAVVAVLVQLLLTYVFGSPLTPASFVLMQGQRMLLYVLVAGFATVYGHATIMFFFVLPMKARWFLWLEVVVAFIYFLQSRDLAGFAGVCTAIYATYAMLGGRGPRRLLREWRLRIERKVLEARLAKMKKKRGLRVVPGGKEGGRGGKGNGQSGDPWIH